MCSGACVDLRTRKPDVADSQRQVPALLHRSGVARQIGRSKLERVFARRKRLTVRLTVPRDAAARRVQERTENTAAVEIELHMCGLAQLVRDTDEVGLLVAVRRELLTIGDCVAHDGDSGVQLDLVRQEDRLVLLREVDFGLIGAVGGPRCQIRAPVPPEGRKAAMREHAGREYPHGPPARVEHLDREDVGPAKLDHDVRLPTSAAAGRGERLRDPRPRHERALRELQPFGDRECRRRRDEQADQGYRRQEPLQGSAILRLKRENPVKEGIVDVAAGDDENERTR
jgi:hypothetical protein